MAAPSRTTIRERRPGAQLRGAARAVLNHIAAHGPADMPQIVEIVAACRAAAAGCTPAEARAAMGKSAYTTTYNLESQGYTERKVVDGVLRWRLTELGDRAALGPAAWAPPAPPPPRKPALPSLRPRSGRKEPAAEAVAPPPPAEPAPTGPTIVWAKRRVALPAGPRSVFDLGGMP